MESKIIKLVNYGLRRMWENEAYREICKKQGFNELPKVRRIEEIPKLPVLRPEHLVEYDSRLWLRGASDIYWTSGTTKKKRIPKNRDDWDYISQNMKEAFLTTFDEGDKVINALPTGMWVASEMCKVTAREMHGYISMVNCSSRDNMFLKVLEEEKPNGAIMFSRGAVLLGEKLGGKCNIKKILIGGEPSSKERKKYVIDSWSLEKLVDLYATTEFGATAFAEDLGFYTPTSGVLVQIVDKNNELVGEKEKGIIRLTALTGNDLVVHFINYEIGDEAKLIEGENYATLFDEIDRYGDEAFIGAAQISRNNLESALYALGNSKLSTDNYDAIVLRERKTGYTKLIIELKARGNLTDEEKRRIEEQYLIKLFEINPPVGNEVKLGVAEVKVLIRENEDLVFEKLPGKPRRIIKKELLDKFNIKLEDLL